MFTHLHVHTEYSMLDGISRIPDLVNHTKSLGMESLAITDHGTFYGGGGLLLGMQRSRHQTDHRLRSIRRQ